MGIGFRVQAERFATKARRHEENADNVIGRAQPAAAAPKQLVCLASSSCLGVMVAIVSELQQGSGFRVQGSGRKICHEGTKKKQY